MKSKLLGLVSLFCFVFTPNGTLSRYSFTFFFTALLSLLMRSRAVTMYV